MHYQKTKRDITVLGRFLSKKNDILRLFECLEFSESTPCYQKSRCDCIVALCILLKRLSNPCRCKDMVPLFEWNPTGLRLIFALGFLYQRYHHRLESWDLFFCATAIFTEIWRCSGWQRRTFIELFWLCLWNNCSHLQTKGWCMAVTLEQWCKISGCGFARWLDYQPWRVMGKPKYDCVLCFMNWVY